MQIILYTGQGCGLCDQAEAILQGLPNYDAIELEKIDVRTTTELYHLYGARIPVLFRKDNQSELPWPFDFIQLSEFLR